MITKSADELRGLVGQIFRAAGANEANAEMVAEHLVLSNLRGVDSHGVFHVPGYVAAIRRGDLLPSAAPEILRETANSALISGGWTFGHVVARYAMEVGLEKAAAQGMAVIGLVQAHHVGRVGTYAEMASARGMIGLVWAGGYGSEAPVAAPYGGAKAILHTNPVAIGVPAGAETPILIDYATTMIAGSKVRRAKLESQQLPPGSIIDKHGNPSTDPDAYFDGGALLPFGGHKGYALMLAVELLGRVFTGADAHLEGERGGPNFRHQGVTMIVFKADLFQPLADFTAGVDELEQRVRAVPTAPGFGQVLVPGDLERRATAARGQDGIPLSDEIWQSLVETAESLGLEATAAG
jgi:LDH2 family malate/lactate/ureidoglycolate dehydrogenase